MADGKGIFLDILPRFDMAATSAILSKVTNMFKGAGKDIGAAFGGEAEVALRRMQDELIKYQNVATEAYTRAAKASGDAQVAEARYNELRAKGLEDTSARMIAAENRVNLTRENAVRTAEAQAIAEGRADKSRADVMEASAAKSGLAATNFGKAFNVMGATAAAGSLLIIGETGKMAESYEANLQRIQSATGETTDNIKALHDGLLALAPAVGTSLQELTNASYIAAKAGIKDAGDQLKYVATAAQLAKIEAAPLETTMKALTTTMQDFSFPATQTADVASMIRTAAGDAKVSLDEFAGSVHNLEPIFKSIVAGDASKAAPMFAQMSAMLAGMTQNGTSADQASENLRNTMIHLINPIQSQRDMVGELGGSFANLSKQIGDPNVGPIGVLTEMNDLITKRLTPDGQAHIAQLYQSADAADELKRRYDALTPGQKKLADEVENGTANMSAFKKATRENVDGDSAQLAQWDAQRKILEGFDPLVKKYGTDLLTLQQAWKGVGGTDQSFLVASQLFGNQAAIDDLKKRSSDIQNSHADSKGDVEGFNGTADTLKFKMDAAKQAVHSLGVELGEAFLPSLKTVADALKDVAQWLAQHQQIAQGLVIGLGVLGGAWATLKVAMFIGDAVKLVASGFMFILDTATKAMDGTVAKVLSADEAFGTLGTTAATANEKMAASGAAAQEGAIGVKTAAAEEVVAEQQVTAAATEADGALANGAGAGAAGAARRIPLPVMGAPFVVGDAIDQHDPNAKRAFDSVPDGGDLRTALNPDGTLKNGHAGGGVLPGYSTRDNMIGHIPGHGLIGLAGGEGIVKARAVQHLGPGFIHSLNAHFDTGGIAPGGSGGWSHLYEVASSMQGMPYSQGSRTDCSGDASMLVNAALGQDPNGSKMTTKTAGPWLAQRGFVTGYGGPGTLRVGWYDHGPNPNDGHMAVTLPDGTPAEGGGSHGSFAMGAGAAGAENPEFDRHMYLPANGLYPQGDPSGGGGFSPFGGSGGGLPGLGGLGGPGGSGGGSHGGTGGIGSNGGGGAGSAGGFYSKLASTLTEFLLQLALGNPMGNMLAGQRQGGSGSGVLTPDQVAAMSPEQRQQMLAADARSKSLNTLDNAKNPAAYGKDLTSYNDLLLRQANATDKSVESQEGLQTKLETLNGSLKQHQDHLDEQKNNPKTKPSAIESTQNQIGKINTQIQQTQEKLDQTPATVSSLISQGLTLGAGGQGRIGKLAPAPGVGTDSASAPDTSMKRSSLDALHDYAQQAGSTTRSALDALHDAPHLGQLPAGVHLGDSPGGQEARRGVLPAPSMTPTDLVGIHDPTRQAGPMSRGALDGVHGGDTGAGIGFGRSFSPAGAQAGVSLGGIHPQATGPTPSSPLQGSEPGANAAQGASPAGRAAATPPATASRQPGADQNVGPGFGIGGGMIGMAESAATMGLGGMGGPAGAAAAGAAGGGGGGGGAGGGISALANRTIGYLGQLAGIGVEGLFETFGLNDSPIGDPTKSLFGKVALGIAGGHQNNPNDAGKTQPPLKPPDNPQDKQGQGSGQPPGPLVNIEHQHIENGDGGEAGRDTARQFMQYGGGGRG